jgi:hypothetical protein
MRHTTVMSFVCKSDTLARLHLSTSCQRQGVQRNSGPSCKNQKYAKVCIFFIIAKLSVISDWQKIQPTEEANSNCREDMGFANPQRELPGSFAFYVISKILQGQKKMQLSVAATLLAQCVPSLSQKFIVQHLRSTNDNN